ncbi:MAG TPA: antitoxin Xre/MbcA/ParS toxin-binding domain-containing protein [Gemmatimonadaceae bacterium]|nr:antitoxin Xre/MbcA/ParS toxin-binding domain-containing protein [Gemmatimonadaceae bacterium]
MNRRELERWLCGPDVRGPDPAEIARLLGVPLDDIGDTTLLRTVRRLRAVRFVLAVLRDVYADDGDVRRWIRKPRAELENRRALDLLLAGRAREVEELVLREWHRQMVPLTGGALARMLATGPRPPYTIGAHPGAYSRRQ